MKYPSSGSFINSHGNDRNSDRADMIANSPRSSRAITSSRNPRPWLPGPKAVSNSTRPRLRITASTASTLASAPIVGLTYSRW